MESDVELVIEEQNYIADLETKLAKLQAKYMRILNNSRATLPPPIKTEILNGVAKQMDKLESQICSLRERQ